MGTTRAAAAASATFDEWCARRRCWSTRSASTGRQSRRSECAHPRSRRRRSPSPSPAADARARGGQVLPQFPPTIGRIAAGDRLNAQALREITDDSGGRTEVVRDARDLSPATASIADELSRQYPSATRAPAVATAAGTPSAWKCATDPCKSERVAVTPRRDRASLASALQQRASQDHERDREIDHQARHVDERGNERRRRCRRIEPQSLQKEWQQRSAQRPPQHDTD